MEKSVRYLKKIVAAGLMVIMMLNLCACGTDVNRTAKNLKVNEKTTVKVWYTDEQYASYIEYVAKRFNESNELVTIVPVLVANDNYVDTIYEQSIHKDNVADVYFMSSDELSKACLLGLAAENNTYNKYYTEKNYGKAAIAASTYNGKLYGYPLSFNTAFMVYNKSVVEEMESFNKLTEFSDSFELTDENQSVTQVVDWDVSDMLVNYGFSAGSLNIGGESGEDSSKIEIDVDKLKAAMSQVAVLRDAYGIVRLESTQETCIEQFCQGSLAYTIVDAGYLKRIDDSDVEYAVAKLPKLGEDMELNCLSETTLAVVNTYAGNLEAAKAVAHALSYDYVEEFFTLSGQLCARNIIDKKAAGSYATIYEIYASSEVKAKFLGSSSIYTNYEIMLHKIWDGEDSDACVDEFVKSVGINISDAENKTEAQQ